MAVSSMRNLMRNVVVLVFILSLGQRSCGLECYNGREERRSDNATSCDCFQGWAGDQCQLCEGRIRLNSSGVVRDHFGGGKYASNSKCVFFIEADSPTASIHLRVNFFQMECQWDYLYIYDGDSVFSPKLAAFTGNLLEQPYDGLPLLPKPVPNIATSNSSIMSGSGSGDPDVNVDEPEPYQEPLEVTLSSNGPHLLMYFYTDLGVNDLGFEFSYWLTYECPDNCSGRGVCDDNGTCSCFTGWAGQFCQLSVCPNDCFSNGICNDSIGACQCYDGFTGTDCSTSVESPRWEIVDYTVTPEGSLPPSVIARAGHSAVVWMEYMVVYGGYQFPSGDMPEGEDEWQLLRYRFATKELERFILNDTQLPELRYGHSAVVYEDKMYIFGGSKFPTEEITNELWSLDLMTVTWTNLSPDDNSSINGSSVDGGDVVSMADSTPSRDDYHPIAVRSHTAHVVGSKMVVFFGLSQGELPFVPFVQEYDFVTGNWTTPSQYGFKPVGRMGHSSVYSLETGLIYVYGGREGENLLDQVLVYDPITYTWSRLTGSGSPHYFHSATIYGSLMLLFGGCDRVGEREDCFSNNFFVYNIACDSWYLGSEYTGLPGNSSRYGHSSVLDPCDSSLLVFGGFLGTLHHDILRLYTGNCSAYTTQEDCLNGSALCAWSTDVSQCVPAVEGGGDLVYNCTIDPCRGYRSCGECNDSRDEGCVWDSTSFTCVATVEDVQPAQCPSGDSCDRYSTCGSCFSHDCSWSEECVAEQTSNDTCSPSTTCSSHTSCRSCTNVSCLWCPALNQCLPTGTYPVMYPYGQCLGWISSKDTCPGECSSLKTCSSCEEVVDCGWCNDPSNTGLGTCAEGGFLGSRNDTTCQEERWYYYQCPACQCNGHSSCVNDSSVCEQCQNNTAGDKCQECAYAYFGDPANGGTCDECNCNGYNPTCENRNGTCSCLDMGVSGNNCTSCNRLEFYVGDADNFCYYPLQVGFIYTFEVQSPFDRQSFYTATPGDDKELNFEFEISHNPDNQIIEIQLFLGKRSENLWVLRNLTDPISLGGESTHKDKLDDFGSTKSANKSQLFSFTRPLIRTSTNFTSIFNTASENDYTHHMWNGDVTLIIFVSNLTNPMTFKITVDQMDLLFLLYFFATFITCFTILLAAFLGGWYVKRKLAFRSMMRQQVIELQRRVSRGFARIKVILDKKPHYEVPQTPTYTGVESLKNNKAAILTVFVRLPGDSSTGRPTPGRTGLCFGSTLVRMNSSKSSRSKEARRRGRERSAADAVSPSTAEV